MAKIPVWNWKKEQVGEVALPAERLRVPVPHATSCGRSSRRTSRVSAPGTHKTKVRSEVSGSRQEALQAEGNRPRAAGRRSSADPPPRRHRARSRAALVRAGGLGRREEERPQGGPLATRRGGADRRPRQDGCRRATKTKDLRHGRRRARNRGQGPLRGRPGQRELRARVPQRPDVEDRRPAGRQRLRRAGARHASCSRSRRSRASSRTWEASDGRAESDPAAAHHREGHADEGSLQHGLLRGRPGRQQDRGRPRRREALRRQGRSTCGSPIAQGKWKRMGRFVGQRKAWKKA